MPPTSALRNDPADALVADIEQQFQLGPDALVGLTRAFLDEVALGLSEYGHPMAMMCVPHLFFPGCGVAEVWVWAWQPDVRYRCAGRHRDWVSGVSPQVPDDRVFKSRYAWMVGLSWRSISAARICESSFPHATK